MNKQYLNVNTVFVNPSSSFQKNQANQLLTVLNKVENINTIINANTSSNNKNSNKQKYKVTKYLGAGIHGDLYLAVDTTGNRYILKKIVLDALPKENSHQTQQIRFELGLLDYLSNNKSTREHINPCVESILTDRTVYTIFPVFQGYSLYRFHKYLEKMSADDYYKILFFLIKSLLHALAKIHDTHIAHQNINENSILVSTFINPREIKVKFTDFGLGCGSMVTYPEHIVTNARTPDAFLVSNAKCDSNLHAPIQINNSIIHSLSESDYLNVAQKWDVFNLGLIFLKYLLYFDSFTRNIDYKHNYDKYIVEKVKKVIEAKYLSGSRHTLFPTLSASHKIKKLILEYVKMINKYILVPTPQRRSAQYILDKLIIYEKYKDDIF